MAREAVDAPADRQHQRAEVAADRTADARLGIGRAVFRPKADAPRLGRAVLVRAFETRRVDAAGRRRRDVVAA